MYIRKILIARLVEAALDQPAPTPALSTILNAVLSDGNHPDQLDFAKLLGHLRARRA